MARPSRSLIPPCAGAARGNTNARAASGAFSLVEVTLALGIVAFALVGIMALFPAAIRASEESRRETRATFIAQQVFGDLMASPNPTNAFVGAAPSIVNSPRIQGVNLAANRVFLLGFDEEGLALGTNSPSVFSNAISSGRWAYAARLEIATNNLPPGLSRVDLLVTAPAAAPLDRRSQYPFVSLLRNR